MYKRQAKNHVNELETQKKIQAEALDVTLPASKIDIGNLHPLTKVQSQLEDIFLGMGFTIAEGPEVETDYYNFTALNTDVYKRQV